ncbi:MAG TPA: transcription antitermination factor NusB [Acidiphilium sp.]|jgi:N utilization substance protein B|uniref:transcription antitermination factor NusB n=1 Tax=unclassified Acidiphilium TaxID=2617493 RepID=UPI000BD81348|nr:MULTISPECIES: transcription antitermination factor NusB [unclassified Acidiphilium]OYV57120.1 MAG: transcription antitermination factor NusB [Acidiphilium sp. 20-67-58]HQT60733.1 transcription antitermination factor NusB [Acidiphilium sp.]HQU10213.1 transcription antitermination factor NusB [Acidiphilium sp.]
MKPAGKSARPRTLARAAAVQALYQCEHAGETAETVIDQFVRHRFGRMAGLLGAEESEVAPPDVPLFSRIVRTATAQQDMVDPLIAGVLPEAWPMQRLDPVLRALLRAAGAELWMTDGPPARVVINEYLDVAHGFLEGEAVQMGNAVLDRIARTLREGEFAGEARA